VLACGALVPGKLRSTLDRNALVVGNTVLGNTVLGNTAAAGRSVPGEVRAVLADYLAHHDPVLRVHAVWAARRLGCHDLMPLSDPDPTVQHELQAH
jgi:hypothetical protein